MTDLENHKIVPEKEWIVPEGVAQGKRVHKFARPT
jgi:hypothetical protein